MACKKDSLKKIAALIETLNEDDAPAAVTDLGRPVVVTTEHRGVFFGYSKDTSGDTVVLNRCRMCVYWSSDMKGVMGLASVGPSKTCKIGPPVNAEIRAVTSVMEATKEAVDAWEKSPWA